MVSLGKSNAKNQFAHNYLLCAMVAQRTESSAKKVCIIGPECTGKTELSQFLSEHYKCPWVAEYARAYLNKLGRSYDESDLVKIAHGQLRMEDEWLSEAKNL